LLGHCWVTRLAMVRVCLFSTDCKGRGSNDYVGEDNPARTVDGFIGELDLSALGFGRVERAATGRPAYDPAMLPKIYFYGYLNCIHAVSLFSLVCLVHRKWDA
jgi:hypothetical protein